MGADAYESEHESFSTFDQTESKDVEQINKEIEEK